MVSSFLRFWGFGPGVVAVRSFVELAGLLRLHLFFLQRVVAGTRSACKLSESECF